jgi:hypothetical protein
MKKLLLLIVFLSGGAAQAATVQLNSDNNAIAIVGLQIAGAFYDVEFGSVNGPTPGYQSWIQQFGDDTTSLASDAIVDMAALLTSAGADRVAYADGFVGGPRLGIWVNDWSYGGLCLTPVPNTTIWALPLANGTWEVDGNNCIDAPDSAFTAANFKTSAVPVPAAVWLFASGIGVLGWIRRKRRLES